MNIKELAHRATLESIRETYEREKLAAIERLKQTHASQIGSVWIGFIEKTAFTLEIADSFFASLYFKIVNRMFVEFQILLISNF